MKYTIIYKKKVFVTNWYNFEDHWKEGMTVINNAGGKYSTDGENFLTIQEDRL